MNNKVKEVIINAPEVEKKLTNLDLLYGKAIEPIKRLEIISADDFEDLVREWATGFLKEKYEKVRKSSGAGDMGRDVIGYIKYSQDGNAEWDNYQCKHYDKPITPKIAILEIGKLLYYTFKGEFNVPKNYFFVSPKGAGPQLVKLIDSPEKFKEKLISEWDKTCRKEISAAEEILLEGAFKKYVERFDFTILKDLDPQELIEQHAKTKYHFYRFGGIIPSRPNSFDPPENIDFTEQIYIKRLFEAYSDYYKKAINKIDDLKGFKIEYEHFNRQRKCFYEAESLKLFERDILPEGVYAFEELVNEVYEGIIDEVDNNHNDGYEKVKEVSKIARNLPVRIYPLESKVKGNDLQGICHHLVNNNKFKWVKN
ncbi:ABC-three component system protein [Exiguobacterium sp. NG55]|uniref:ABC-three component system protein n=1 Tax=Exiguobacterium sp. NG55 TaxID=375477 RepID=UPI000558795A|nr:ABC-three component system protein [Exiguobacterium sp. NG55]